MVRSICKLGVQVVSPPMSIAYIGVRFFAHATEDPDKAIKAIQNILPAKYVDDIAFEMHSLQGHYGNPILLFEARIKKKEVAMAFAKDLLSHPQDSYRGTVHDELGLPIENGNVYIRLDKQAAFEGELKRCNSDPICLRIRFKKGKAKDIVRTLQELGKAT